jgi:3-deoxy-7-phosphoheptulonate synthase
LTLNVIRALVGGGFADLDDPEYWELDFVKNSPVVRRTHLVPNLNALIPSITMAF